MFQGHLIIEITINFFMDKCQTTLRKKAIFAGIIQFFYIVKTLKNEFTAAKVNGNV